jgi:Kdo2-lipid IVA lauroyltransferase/acyltransferase
MLWIICSRFFGWLWWWIIPIRKKMVIANYQHCFPKRPIQELRISIGDIVTQYIFLLFGKRAQVELPEDLSRGGVCLAGHASTWDIALISVAEHIPITIFLRKPSGYFSAKLIEYLRRDADIQALYGRNCLPTAYRSLQEGRLVIFVQDHRFNDGIPSTFFNKECLTSPAFASMAYNTNAPIYGSWQYNKGSNIKVNITKLEWKVPSNKEHAIQSLTQKSQDYYQQMISEKPYSWLWLHDRWKIPNKK